jgi:hypothetical protein
MGEEDLREATGGGRGRKLSQGVREELGGDGQDLVCCRGRVHGPVASLCSADGAGAGKGGEHARDSRQVRALTPAVPDAPGRCAALGACERVSGCVLRGGLGGLALWILFLGGM